MEAAYSAVNPRGMFNLRSFSHTRKAQLTLSHQHLFCYPPPFATSSAIHPFSPITPSTTPPQAAESLEALEAYPAEPEVHKYLLDRLTRVTDLDQLYELHCHMITLGKV
jgi:hypothetical protein